MAQQTVNIGASANDGTGDALRTAFDKINDNFTELYSVTAAGSGNNVAISGNSIISENSNGDIILDPNGTGNVVIATAANFRITDHTDNAVVYVDSDGDVQFSSSLTFDGTDLTAASAKISDLTSGRVTYAGTSGALQDSANLTFNGTTLTTTALTVDSISINDNNITSNVTNANIVLSPSGTGTVDFVVPSQTTVGAAGAANALPATPSGYVKVAINGVEYVIPYYAVS